MAIDLYGHTRYSIPEANRRLDYARREHPEWFKGPLHLHEAAKLGPFGAEIASEFGIDAQCLFGLFVYDKERLDVLGPRGRVPLPGVRYRGTRRHLRHGLGESARRRTPPNGDGVAPHSVRPAKAS